MLKDVQQLRATGRGAFVALSVDGTVTTWGDPEFGGDSAAVQDAFPFVS